MKIAYVLNTYPLPSQSFIRRELQALEAEGVEVLRLAMRRADVDLVDPQDRAEAARTSYILERGPLALAMGALTIALRRPRRMWQALRLALKAGHAGGDRIRQLIYLTEAACVARLCAKAGITHVHAHFGTNATMVAMLVQALGGPRYSFTVHGPEEFDAPMALSLGDKLDRAAFAVGVSQFGRSQLCRWAAFDTWSRLKVVHCGIEPDRFSDPKPLPGGPLELVSIGRFVEQKGQMVLVQAMVHLRESHPDLHLTLVGDGPMRGDLEAAIARAGLHEAITLTGWLDEKGVRARIDAAHALVMPSFAEGLPMVVMEAMAAARPVIATYIAGTPELVLPGQTGWLVPAGDARALSTAIADLAATPPDQLADMAQKGRARVLQRHDVHNEARKLAGLFATAPDHL